MAEILLYDYELDEDSYRVRLLLGMLGLSWRTVAVDMFPGGEQRKPPLLALNPTGTLPILREGDLTLYGPGAILLYLAHAHDPARTWMPEEPAAYGQVAQWLIFSECRLQPAVAARLEALFGAPGDGPALRQAARAMFRIMDDHMTARRIDGCEWFVGEGPTLADIALFPSFALSRDYGIDHDDYPALRRWIRRVRAIAGFRTMPGIPDYH